MMDIIVDSLLILVRTGLQFETLSKDDVTLLQRLNEDQWQELINLANQQGVAAICYDSIEASNNVFKAPQNVIIMFYGIAEIFKQQYASKRAATEKMLKLFGDNGVKMMVLKGMSLNRYYPKPEHRHSGDIDIYLGENYQRGNDLLIENGAYVEHMFYRHAEIRMGKEMIENHCWFSTKAEGEDERLESLFKEYAGESLELGSAGIEIYPSANFNALFLAWHSMAHFLWECISLRHLTDWAMFLIYESPYVEESMYRKAKTEYRFGLFSDVLTSIAIHYLNIPQKNIPVYFIEEASKIEKGLYEKVFRHIFTDSVINHAQNKWIVRLCLIRKMFENRWKFREIYNMGFVEMLFRKVKFVLFEEK